MGWGGPVEYKRQSDKQGTEGVNVYYSSFTVAKNLTKGGVQWENIGVGTRYKGGFLKVYALACYADKAKYLECKKKDSAGFDKCKSAGNVGAWMCKEPAASMPVRFQLIMHSMPKMMTKELMAEGLHDSCSPFMNSTSAQADMDRFMKILPNEMPPETYLDLHFPDKNTIKVRYDSKDLGTMDNAGDLIQAIKKVWFDTDTVCNLKVEMNNMMPKIA